MTLAYLIFEPPRRHGHAAVPGEDLIDLSHVGGRNGPAEGAQVFRYLGGLAKADQCGADDWVAQRPAQRKLRQRLAVFCGEALEVLDRLEVAGEMLGAEQGTEQVEIAEHAALRAPVVFVEPHARVKGATQHAVSERPISRDADLVHRTIGEDLSLHAPVEHVPAILHDVDRAQPHAVLDLRQAKVRDSDKSRLALPYDVVERSHRLVEWCSGVGPVHEENVDMVGLQPLQALFDRRQDPGAAAVAAAGHFLVADAEFGDDRDIPAAAAERPRQGLFRHSHTIGLGGVEAGDAVVDRLLYSARELGFVDPAIGAADFPAPEADRRDLDAGLAELPVFHVSRSVDLRIRRYRVPNPSSNRRSMGGGCRDLPPRAATTFAKPNSR